MIIKLALLVVLAAAVSWAIEWYRRTPAAQRAKVLKKSALYGVIGLFILLALSGRLSWLVALAAAAVPLLQRGLAVLRLLPLVQQLLAAVGLAKASTGPAAGRQSRVETAWLRMTLDHDSGRMDGEVLQGPSRGSLLSGLSLVELLVLRRDCDPRSLPLLEAYLDRERGDSWRRQADSEDPGEGGPSGSAVPPAGGKMSPEEARAILGLEPGASAEQVRDAHRRLMQRLHPDRGGSTFLAAMINEAKRVLS